MFETSELPSREGVVFETSVSEVTPTLVESLDEFGDRASMSRGFGLELELLELELLEAGGWRLEVGGSSSSRLVTGGWRPEARGCSVDLLIRRGFCCLPC